MELPVERILWRNVKRKLEYQDPFPVGKIFRPFDSFFHVCYILHVLYWLGSWTLIGHCWWLDAVGFDRQILSLSSPVQFYCSQYRRALNCLCFSYRAIPVGAVSYSDIDGQKFKRDVLFCYDLKLPEGFVPNNQGKYMEAWPSSVENAVDKIQIFVNMLTNLKILIRLVILWENLSPLILFDRESSQSFMT